MFSLEASILINNKLLLIDILQVPVRMIVGHVCVKFVGIWSLEVTVGTTLNSCLPVINLKIEIFILGKIVNLAWMCKPHQICYVRLRLITFCLPTHYDVLLKLAFVHTCKVTPVASAFRGLGLN